MEKVKKNELIAEIKNLLNDSSAIYLIDFAGMTVAEVENMRGEFFKANIKYKVVKNTLALRALKESESYGKFSENLESHFKSNTGIVFTDTDPVAPAKILKKLTEKTAIPKYKAAIVDGVYYGENKLNELSSLLSREEIIAGILACLESPVSGIVGSINAVIRDLASVIEKAAKKRAA